MAKHTELENAEDYLIQADKIEKAIRHPATRKPFATRYLFQALTAFIHDFEKNPGEPSFIYLYGLPGIGKTVLLNQLAHYCLNSTRSSKVFYLDVKPAYEAQDYESFISKIPEVLQMDGTLPNIIFIDNIDRLTNSEAFLKALYENTPHILKIISGSVAEYQKWDPNIPVEPYKIFPLKFSEFVKIKTYSHPSFKYYHPVYHEEYSFLPIPKSFSYNLKQLLAGNEGIDNNGKWNELSDLLNKTNYWPVLSKIKRGDRKAMYREYLSYHNWPGFMDYQKKGYILKKVMDTLNKHLHWLGKEGGLNKRLYKQVLNELAIEPYLDHVNLSEKLKTDVQTLNYVFTSLESLGWVQCFEDQYGHNQSAIFFISPTIRRALLSRVWGKKINAHYRILLWKDWLASTLYRNFYEYEISHDQDCFILSGPESKIYFRWYDQSNAFMPDHTGEKMVIINGFIEQPEIEGNIIHLPLSWALLL